MSKRYYIAPVIGEGTEESPYRAKVPVGMNHTAVIDIDPATGQPAQPFALVIVAAANHSALLSDPEIDALPDVPMSGNIGTMGATMRNNMRGRLAARGINGQIARDSDNFGQVVRAIGRHLNPEFNEDHLNVSE